LVGKMHWAMLMPTAEANCMLTGCNG
jgi:hypothetical protein